MNKAAQGFFVLLLVTVLMFAPLANPAGVTAQTPPPLPDRLIPIPQETLDQFQSMPVAELLARLDGPVPHALEAFSDRLVSVIVEFEGQSLAERLAEGGPMAARDQTNYTARLQTRQAAVISRVQQAGGALIGQFTKAYNGVQVRVPAKELAGLRAMSGVKAVHPVRTYTPALSYSTGLINSHLVWELQDAYDQYVTGQGVTIAIIDTGIDYTHKSLGGEGDPADYSGNDPDIIESGTFPTAKVKGGTDFAGSLYDASSTLESENTPVPDPDPLDENGHGTHVASTAAGLEVDEFLAKGVAPGADLYALKVFGASGSTDLVAPALEWCADPNGDGNLDDHIDVINLSLGSAFGVADAQDPEMIAIENLTALGAVVVAASGNDGNTAYITGAPGAADSAISVAATTSGQYTGPVLRAPGNVEFPYFPSGIPGTEISANFSAALAYAGSLAGAANDELCSTTGLTPGVLTGKIALIQRGTCDFSVKVSNAKTLGAAAAVVFNHTAGGDELLSMGGTAVPGTPAMFVGHSAGVALKAYDGQTVEILSDALVTGTVGPDDALAGFSSRGPRGFDSVLKPEVAAPGTNIFAAAMGSGAGGTTMEGTSMATPHVTGAVALIQQMHPDWTSEQIKAALMNTAVQVAAELPQVGAGRVDAVRAIETTSFAVGDARLVSLNWGLIEFNTAEHSLTKTVTVTNEDTAAKTYSLSWAWGSGSNDYGANLTLNPETIHVGPGSTATFDVVVDLNAQAIHAAVGGWPDTIPFYLGEYFGLIQLQNTNELKSDDVLTLPFYFLPQPYSTLTASSLIINPATDIATGSLDHNGPVQSLLEVWPVYATDPEESAVRDNADLRMVMMDWFADGKDYVGFGFNLYGSLHDPQRYITEIDLYLDVDQDGTDDYKIFNINESSAIDQGQDNLWSLVMIDLETGLADWGSDYYIWTDFNSGTMFWNLPASWYELGPSASQFDFSIESYDFDGEIDLIPSTSADYRQVPFYSELGRYNPLGHQNVPIELAFTSPAVYADGLIEGAALFDYSGKAGPGQVTLLNFEIGDPGETGSQVFLPLVVR